MTVAERRALRLGLLSDFDFRQVFLADVASQMGTQVSRLAIPLVAVLALDAGPGQVAALTTASSIPFVLVALPAGVIVDRLRRRRLLIGCDLARALLIGSVPVAWTAHLLALPWLCLVVFTVGALSILADVSHQSYLPHLVGRENLVEGNARLQAVTSTSQVAGPALSAILIQVLTAPIALAADVVSYVMSALLLSRVRSCDPPGARAASGGVASSMLAGLRLVVNDRRLRAIAICTAWSNLFSCIAFTMLIVLLAGDLRIEPFQIGMYYSVAAVGGVIGAVLATRITDLIGQSRAIWMAPALSAPVAMAMAVAQPGWLLWVSALGVSAYWFGAVVYNVAQTSMRQQICPENMLGRMNATIRFFVWGMFPLGAAAGGLIGSYLGTREAIWFGMAMNCLAFLAPFFSPLRKRSPRLAPGGEFAAEGGMVHEGNRGSARSRRA